MEIEQRLIDQMKVYQNACTGCIRHGEMLGECYHDEPCERLIFAFTVAEPVDAVEVAHGRWEQVAEADYKCSVCGFRFTAGDPISMFPYCRCGAKMDGGKDHDFL